MTITNDQFPGILRSTFCEKNSIDSVLPEPCVCQKTPSLPRSSGGACRSSSIRASALLTPRYWWLRASSLTNPPGRSWKATKFSIRSSRRSFVHMPRMTVSSETDPSSPSELIFFHSEKNSQPDVMVPTLVSAPLERTMKPFGSEQVRDRVAVVAEVVVVGVLQVAVRRLQLDEHERDAVDEADQVGAPVVQVGVDPEL